MDIQSLDGIETHLHSNRPGVYWIKEREETPMEKKFDFKKYQEEFDRQHTRRVYIKLYDTTDAEILAHLDKVGNKQGYIKKLIREDMKRNPL